MTRSRLFLLALTLLLTLPPGLFAGQEAIIQQVAPVPGRAAPQDASRQGVAHGFDARKRNDRKAKQRQRHERGEPRRERQRPSPTPEEAGIEALPEGAPPRILSLAVDDDPCGPGLIQLPESGRCTHGPDPEPPAARAAARSLEVQTPAALCEDDDGISGFRVQVLYLRATNGQDRYTASLNTIRAAAEGANTILRDSQPGPQEMLTYQFVRNAACEIEVANVAIPQASLVDFDATMVELAQRGYDRIDRIYLMFADTQDADICGIGTVWPDDRKTAANYNNSGPNYSRADLGCWDAHTAAHELMHNLGAVQDSAPHSTGFGHCFDEYDVMCYRDDRRAPPMQLICGPSSVFEIRYDCNGDDYFNPDPAGGNYLASHWNTADNRFLTQDLLPIVDIGPPTVSLVTSTTRVKAKKRVALTAAVANPPASGASVEFRVCRGGGCTWATGQSLGVFPGPTAITTWKAGGKGQVTFLAQVTSETGTAASNPVTVSVKKVKKKR